MNNPGMDQQVYLNDLVRNPVETQRLQEYLLSSPDTNMSYVNVTSQATASLNIWSASSSGEQPQDMDSDDETKMEHMWAVSLSGNGGGGPRIEESQFEATNTLSLETMNTNTDNHQIHNSQPFPQSSSSNGYPFDPSAGYVGTSNQALEAGMCPHDSGLVESKHVLYSGGSSSTSGSSSRGVGNFTEEGEGRLGDSLDGWRVCRKRKFIKGVPEQASSSGSSILFHQFENSSVDLVPSQYNDNASLNISRSSETLSDSSPAPLNSRNNTNTGLVASDFGNTERTRRSVRIRINPANQHDTPPHTLWGPGNTTSLSTVQSTSQQVPLPIPVTQSPESGPAVTGASSEDQFHAPGTLRLPQIVQEENGASDSRIGSTPSNPIIVGERLTASSVETHFRSMLTDNSSDSPAFLAAAHTRQSDPPTWDLLNESAVIPGNIALTSQNGPNLEVQPLDPNVVPHENPPAQHRRRLSEIRQLLTSLGSSASGGVNALQRSVQPATSQDIERPSGAGMQGYRLEYIRSAMMMGSQRDAVPSIPVMRPSAASREQRSRMIFEIRHVLDLMRRGEDLQPEDVHLFDRYPYFGGADLLDRHRDMRLDVDNMSYEELLALEERIGDVSTGLSEETILKLLKQRKYVSLTVEASAEVEPCCICQEEYIDGQGLGIPDCEHEFHTACIKQWLMQKNICPICKTTALATTTENVGDIKPAQMGDVEVFEE